MERKYQLVLTLLVLILVTSCAEKPKEKVPEEEKDNNLIISFKHPKTEQNFKIVNAYKLYETYIKESIHNTENSPLMVYKEEVITPVYNDCFKNGEYINLPDVRSILNKAPMDYESIKKLLEEIDTGELNKLIKDALIATSNYLPDENQNTVCIFPSTDMNAALGVTVGAGKIIVFFNQNYHDEIIQTTVAHEYHHSVWTRDYLETDKDTILDNLVFEGKAVMLERLVYPNSAYTTSVNFRYDQEYWNDIKDDLNKTDPNRYVEILYGGNGLPYGYGYSEGYKIVESYLERYPNLTPEEWTGLSAEKIFFEGNYSNHYD